MSTSIRILDTGTRAPDIVPERVQLRHQPALVRRALDFDVPAVVDKRPCHLVFYSRFAVQCVAESRGDVAAGHRLWAVGPKTAALVEELLDATAAYPDEHRFEHLRCAIADCDDPRPIVAFGLRGIERDLGDIARAWQTTFQSVDVYESTPAPPDQLRTAFDEFGPHWLTVTSSRGARSVADAIGGDRLIRMQSAHELSIAAIGPSTASALAELGLQADLVPEQPDRDGLIQEIVHELPTGDV